MPCVLPVLSIKLSSAIKSDGRGALQYRIGFLAAAAGVMVFMWGLAATLFALQQIGVSVGWGLQFQNPTFLALMFVVLTVFAANLFGLFEISLPSGLGTRLAHTGGTSNYGADFATGVFGAVMATPCSAPFLGTAIAFALAGRGVDIAVVFTFLGLGLAMPYIAVAAFPRLVSRLPKPGRWMLVVKLVLGVLLAGTALWLLYVLMGVAGPYAMFTVLGLSLALVAALYFSGLPKNLRLGASVAFFLLPLIAAPLLATAPSARDTNESIAWIPFERGDIARRVSRGEVVFVDVTADWCLTCKANKTLVLDRVPVVDRLRDGPLGAERPRCDADAGRLDPSGRDHRAVSRSEQPLRYPVQRSLRTGRTRRDRAVGNPVCKGRDCGIGRSEGRRVIRGAVADRNPGMTPSIRRVKNHAGIERHTFVKLDKLRVHQTRTAV